MIEGLPAGANGYVRYADLLSLRRASVAIREDENFTDLPEGHPITVSGVTLETLAVALHVQRDSDMTMATCSDKYQGPFPADYVAAHQPILAFQIDGVTTATWAARTRRPDPGPYFVAYSNFKPAFKVLAHEDRAQVPSNVVHIDFTTQAAAYGEIAPRGNFPAGSAERMGFAIAKQNCLRCHNMGPVGGTKAGRTWTTLSTWAREEPKYFESYVKDPKQYETYAKMPGNPSYDSATLAALTAYFRTFTMPADGKSN
jgi:hypothetical protein